jgi:N-acyl amino acid synthase of PEP-CTERM/exosortase system
MHSMLSTAREPSTRPSLRCAPSRIGGLVEAYRNSFDGIQVRTRAQLRAAHRLRYQVFCIENKIFDPAQNPGGLECDEYDEHSLHAVLLHRATQTVVGTVRLVLHKPGARHGSLLFHQLCRHPRLNDPNFLPLETTGEIGRFAIAKAFRPPANAEVGGRLSELGDFSGSQRHLVPQMSLGLIKVALQMCIAQRIRDVCAAMEPSLLRLLGGLGLHFAPLGPPVDYYGMRQPCYTNLVELFARCRVERPEIWAMTTDYGRFFDAGCVADEPAHRETVLPPERALAVPA